MPHRLEPHVRELVDQRLQRHAVLQADRDRRAEGIHQAADGGTFLGHRDEQLAGAAFRIKPDVDVPFVSADVELVRQGVAGIGQVLAPRAGSLVVLLLGLAGIGLRVERLALLAAVAIDGQGFDAELPTPSVRLGDVGRRHVGGHVHRLADRPGEEWLGGGHHAAMGPPADASHAIRRLEGTIEDRQVLIGERRRAFDRVVLIDVLDNRLDLRLVVTQLGQSQRHRAVDNLQHAAAGKLLVLHQGDVRLDAGRIAIHHEADGAGGGEDRCLGIAIADLLAEGQHLVPQRARGILQIPRTRVVDFLHRIAMHLHHAEHRLAVLSEAFKRADDCRHLRAGQVGRPVEQRRDGAADAVSRFGIVGVPFGHDQAPEVGIAQSKRPEHVAVLANLTRRIAGVVHQDFLGDEIQTAGGFEPLVVECAVGLAELHQVDARQIAGGVVQEHIFAARVAGVDPPAVGASVPLVDCGIVLHAGVAAVPGTIGHAAE